MSFMESIAAWIWNPFLSLIYIEIGLLFLILTRGISLRRSLSMLLKIWRERHIKHSKAHHISHMSAFIAALAAGIGVGNLAGVGTAIHLGGPGALFWIWVSSLAGASFRMCSAYFSIKYGEKEKNSPLFATPMSYLVKFTGRSWPRLAPMLAALILFQGLVSANLIQANSVAHAVTNQLDFSEFLVAFFLFAAVAFVVVGGLRSIVDFSVLIAPWMILAYVIGGLLVLLSHPLDSLDAIRWVLQSAFHPYSIGGGIIGYSMMQAMQFGVSRGVFSHFSGLGIAPFFHGANNDHPARGAFLAALVPLVDGLVVCSITGLVILSMGDWQTLTGAYLTVTSFQMGLGDTGRVLVFVCLGLFAFTTIISWAHFSERCFEYLGGRNVIAYRWFFAAITFCGPFFPVAFIWSLADVIIGLILIVHLLPLTYILIKTRHSLMKTLQETEAHSR